MSRETTRLALVTMTVLWTCAHTIPGAHADTVYRWKDDRGVIHFSNRPPPPGVPGAEVGSLSPMPMIGTVPASIGQARPVDGKDSDSAEEARVRREELARRTIREFSYHEALAIECEQARNVMRNLSHAGNPVIPRNDGSIDAMSEDERSRRIHEAARFVHANCR